MGGTRRGLLIGALCTFFGARTALADDACVEAFSAGPEHVKQGRLIQGHQELARCSTEPCPASMRSLCAADLHRLEDRIPTVVFVVKDGAGKDLVDVHVFDDTRSVAETIDGRSLAVDPGSHSFRFEREGSDPVTVNVLVHEGEHARAVEAVLVVKPAAKPVDVPPPAPRTIEARPIPWPVYVTGGLTVVAAAGFGVFGIRGIGERSDLDACKGACAHDPVQKARTSFLIADISLLAGVVLLGATGAFYFTRPAEQTHVGALPWPLAF